ncbi:MAG TPA: hypothetical protein VJT80_11975 [Steroidobacteraceae bacterium]|nr:hypothetical protein [Steroidobacteraceae bacterium]
MQDYVLDDSVAYATVTPCLDADLEAAPAWPVRREEIHTEYSHDDFLVSRRVTRVYWKKEGGEEESARVVDGCSVERSSQTGEKYGSLIAHGGRSSRPSRSARSRSADARHASSWDRRKDLVDRSNWVMP